jgi:ribosomal protein S18 acetylase RimI-like enzyme
MLPEPVIRLIREEQDRQQGRFIQNVDLDAYLAKLATHAEIVSHCVGDRCRGVVAFYCNDLASRQAYITLLVVDPVERGLGLGGALLTFVLQTARRRGFAACRLEVHKENSAALQLYRNHGFAPVADRGASLLLETKLT